MGQTEGLDGTLLRRTLVRLFITQLLPSVGSSDYDADKLLGYSPD